MQETSHRQDAGAALSHYAPSANPKHGLAPRKAELRPPAFRALTDAAALASPVAQGLESIAEKRYICRIAGSVTVRPHVFGSISVHWPTA